jgi:fumarylacetoacetate (FAA) hydrolase
VYPRAPCAKLAGVRLVTFEIEGSARVGALEDGELAELAAATMIDWLAGEGREPSGVRHALDAVRLLAPVPEPPSVRDFFAYEGHVAAGWRRRGGEVPPAWYEAPVFYFSNPASVRGPGDDVPRPPATRELDFELEIAAVIGADGEIAGFTLMNDWSARDVQREEMTVALGPHKGKDFATSLGPWLATPEELPFDGRRLNIEAFVSVNGQDVAHCHANEQYFTWPAMVDHAARDTRLRPGDVLGSGTLTGGCLLELGSLEGGRWLEPGDVVTLQAEGLGRLENRVV